jgi:hypothetical protein
MQRYTVYLYLDTALHVSGRTSSGAHTTVSTASGICHTVTAICRYRGRLGTGFSVLWVAYVYWNILTMHGPINVESPNNTSKWQMGFNSAFKGLIRITKKRRKNARKTQTLKDIRVMTKTTRTTSTPNISTNSISGSSYCLVIHIPVSRHITLQQNTTPPLFVV